MIGQDDREPFHWRVVEEKLILLYASDKGAFDVFVVTHQCKCGMELNAKTNKKKEGRGKWKVESGIDRKGMKEKP